MSKIVDNDSTKLSFFDVEFFLLNTPCVLINLESRSSRLLGSLFGVLKRLSFSGCLNVDLGNLVLNFLRNESSGERDDDDDEEDIEDVSEFDSAEDSDEELSDMNDVESLRSDDRFVFDLLCFFFDVRSFESERVLFVFKRFVVLM